MHAWRLRAAERAARPPAQPFVDARPVERMPAPGQPPELVAVCILRQTHRTRRVSLRLAMFDRRGGRGGSHLALALAPSARSRRIHHGRVGGQDGLVDPARPPQAMLEVDNAPL